MGIPFMDSTPRSRQLIFALYANAAALCAIVLVMVFRETPPSAAMAQMQPAIAGGAGVFVMPAQFSKDTFGCYLLDVDAQTLCVYRFDAVEKQLHLAAARTYKFDRKLGDFNTSMPSPAEVQELLEKKARGTRSPTADEGATTQPPPQDNARP
jgi:hypothetical protein